jgi:tripartite-type tricarboxylate transporter receptor subunit TctC
MKFSMTMCRPTGGRSNNRRRSTLVAVALSALSLSLLAGQAAAQQGEFKPRRVNAIIGYAPGGGTDAVARLIGRYMKNYMPGKPTMVFRNMPAARGTVAADYVAHKTAKDGTYWFAGANAAIDANMLRRKEVTYDPRTFLYFGGFGRGGSLIIMRKEKLPNFKDKSKPPVIVGTTDGSDTWAELLVWGHQYLGWNLKFVIGYPGTSSLKLALQRGEVEAFGTSNQNMLDELLVREKGYAAVSQIGNLSGGKIVARKGSENVPVFADEMKGKLSGTAQETFDYWTKSNNLDKWFFVAPGTPDGIVKIYRDAFQKAAADPEFIARSRKQFGPDIEAQSAKEVLEMVTLTAYPDEKLLNFLRDMKVKVGLPTEPLTQAEKNKLLAKLGIGKKVTASLKDVRKGGRVIVFNVDNKENTARVSSRDTKVMIAGKKAKRSALKAGMNCEVNYPANGGTAMSILCK